MSGPTLVPDAPDTERTVLPQPADEADTTARHEGTLAAQLIALGWTSTRPNPTGGDAA